MTKQELLELQKQGKIIIVENKSDDNTRQSQNSSTPSEYQALLQNLRKIKKTISGVPTFTPRSFFDQFQIYVNGSTRRLYVYADGSWRYVTLT